MPGFFSDAALEPNALTTARAQAEAEGKVIIDLTESNPTKCGFFFPPEILMAAAQRYLSSRRYDPDPRGLPEARRAIRAYYAGRTPPLKISEEQIFITASTSEAYRLLFSLLCDSGDNLLAPQICYPLFETFAADRDVRLHPYRLNEQRNWETEAESLDAARDSHTRALLLISPHNPTGHTIRVASSAVEDLALPLISDEVFAEFTHEAPSAPALGALYPDTPVFHLNGISKMFALPDLKVGWIALNEPAYRRFGARLEILNDAYLSASPLNQAMLPDVFEHGREFARQMASEIAANVRFGRDFLAESGLFEIEMPHGGAFLFPRIRAGFDEESTVLGCLKAGVLVHPGYYYGEGEHPRIMISCLPKRALLETGLGLLIKHIEELKR